MATFPLPATWLGLLFLTPPTEDQPRSAWPMAPHDPLEKAIAHAMHGDTAAFRSLVEATSGPLVRLAARITGSVEEAEDVVQEAYLKAYQAITGGRFDQRSSARTWLYRIVTNAAIDARRSRGRREARDEQQTAERLDDSLDARLALAELADWLDVLPPEQRAAVVLVSIEGMSAAEAGEILGCSEGAIEQRLLRARTTLRRRREEP